jgi:XTP/dITP diphosphohydrolase
MDRMDGFLTKEIVFASTNRGKIAEVTRVAARLGFRVIGVEGVTSAGGFGARPEVSETESTYEGNALKKARAYTAWLSRPCIVDDTGLEIEALGGLPGVYTANFGIARVRSLLSPGYPFRARFVCCVVYAEPSGRCVSVTATLDGTIRFPAAAQDDGSGVPFSAYFIPNGETESVSELSSKGDFLSHRGRAISVLLGALEDSTIQRV